MVKTSGLLRILFLIVAVSIAIVLAVLFRTPANREAARPNIVLLVMDTVRWDVIAEPEEDDLAPVALREIGGRGIVFNRAISPSNWTLPSHASMFTGLYPSGHGVHLYPDRPLDKTPFLGEGVPTLAGNLSALGYETAGIVANPVLQGGYGLDRGFAYYGPELVDPEPTGGLSASAINNMVFQWFEQRRDGELPFFLFVNYFDPHEPYSPDLREFSFETRGRLEAAKDLLESRYGDKNELKRKVVQRREPLSDEERGALRLLYRAEVKAVDHAIMQFMKFLEAKKALDDSVVIIVADHGEHLGEHSLLGHRASLYNQLLHVPLIIFSPALVKKSAEVDCPVSTVGVFDTVMGLANGRKAPGLLARVGRPCRGAGRPVLSEGFADLSFTEKLKRPDLFASRKSLQNDRWKYIWRQYGGGEVYNLSEDPEEMEALSPGASPAMKKWRKRIRKWLRKHPIPQKSPDGIDESLYKKKKLRAIPYL